jgi:hypothetical protein
MRGPEGTAVAPRWLPAPPAVLASLYATIRSFALPPSTRAAPRWIPPYPHRSARIVAITRTYSSCPLVCDIANTLRV